MHNDRIMVSVIMPVYNAVEYVDHTIRSVLEQNYTDFELILVDDGATDGSGDVCDLCAQKDSRIRVIHQKNGGICHARNVGFDLAQGKYIAFCDHDDEMLPNCLEKTVCFAEEENLDIVRFFRKHTDYIGSEKTVDYATAAEKEVINVSNWNSYIYVIQKVASYGVWTGIYRRDFLQKYSIRFDETIHYAYEDTNFLAKSCGYAKQIGILPDVLYHWITRGSINTSRKTGRAIYENRLSALLKWKEEEDNIGRRLGRTLEQAEIRMVAYLKYIMKETCMLDISINEKKIIYRSVKKELLNSIEPKLEKPCTMRSFIQYACVSGDLIWLYEIMHNLSYKAKSINNNIQEKTG